MDIYSFFMQSDHLLGFLITLFIFIITILFAIKKKITFKTIILLLFFSIVAGKAVNEELHLRGFFKQRVQPEQVDTSLKEDFHNQMLHAIENVKQEVLVEKENLQKVMNQVQDIFDSVDKQKQKLQNFIEETKEKLPPLSTSHFSDEENGQIE